MPLQATSGAASQDAFVGNGVAVVPAYIEEVFSCFVYTGAGATQSINNGIDVTGKGALVWLKRRDSTNAHFLFDTARGVGTGSQALSSNTTAAGGAGADIGFSSTGFDLTQTGSNTNGNTFPYASWTFRKQPKFFDIQTWTGSGANRTISHSLGSVPACIIVKETGSANDWVVYHRSLGNGSYIILNSTGASDVSSTRWNDTTPTSTVFTVGTNNGVNGNGSTYVAYLFAHDAGGFGLTGTDNVISCGSFTVSSNVATVTLGYEPQWTMMKRTDSTDDWRINDVMRGSPTAGGTNASLQPNTSAAESTGTAGTHPTATGFTVQGIADGTYIYIAIRRGPMKVPTTGTSVFNPIVRNGTAANATVTGVGFPVDLAFTSRRAASHLPVLSDRLRGAQRTLSSSGTYDEQTETIALTSFASMDGVSFGADNTGYFNGFNNANGASYVNWFFKRAPSYMDIVCHTGDGTTNRQISHNLGFKPEMLISKSRSNGSAFWMVQHKSLVDQTSYLILSATDKEALGGGLTNFSNTTSTYFLGKGGSANYQANVTSQTYVSYLFATAAGVSKVGSYIGTGTTLQIDCGFTAGARFVLIKRTDDVGDWYVWDTARGIISGNDPYLLINTEDAEVTNTDYIDTYSAGFEISSTAPAAINASAGTYIFLAIA